MECYKMQFLIRKLVLKQQLKKKLAISLATLFVLSCMLNWTKSNKLIQKCFAERNLGENEIYKLEDIMLSSKKPKLSRSIFFHETTCNINAMINLTTREACAIESAALANPNLDVFVLFASPTFLPNTSRSPIIEALLSYPNINFRTLNLWTYAASTPIYDWLKDGKLFESKYVLSHTSDFLRYLTLWKWGGTYLDLDVIVKESLENIPPNYAGAESDNFVAAGVINLDNDNFGHEIADLCLRNFQLHFDGSDWGNNGPGVITRVLQDVCKTRSPLLMTRERCFGFQVFPKETFYAIRWWNWKHFFTQKSLNDTLKQTDKSIVVHIWNKHSSKEVVKIGSNVAYAVLAKNFCPKVYKSSTEYL